MNKEVKEQYAHVTADVINKVCGVIENSYAHVYSVSRVFEAYNLAMQENDKPQTCSSCLRNRVRDLIKWYDAYEKSQGAEPKSACTDVSPQVVIYPVKDGFSDIAFTLKGTEECDLYEGKVAFADGNAVSPGKYITVLGEMVIEVVEGGAATIGWQYDDASKEGYISQVDGTVRYPMQDSVPIDFTPNEGTLVEGTALYANGLTVPLGLYTTTEGLTIAVEGDGTATIAEDIAPQYTAPGAPNFVAPAIGVVRHPMADGAMPIDFTRGEEDAYKGTVLRADGSKVKAGTYVTAVGGTIAVQPGGKATYKEEDLT